ncbi:MAG: group III truncated hemoglobin [Candidatus Paceibacterota bacterium]
MKKDIFSRKDIELLVNTFYDKVRLNPTLGPVFNDVAKVNWVSHLPRMYSFWAAQLLGESGFKGNPMKKHIELSKLTRLSEHEFNEWLTLFFETTDQLFEGEKAMKAKTKALNIARLMLHKIQAHEQI